jgi:hypothetical protein
MQKSLQDLDADVRKYGGSVSSDRFEFSKGANKMRVLTFPEIIATHFLGAGGKTAVVCVGVDEGCPYHGEGAPKDERTGADKAPSLKLVSYVIDRRDGKVKLAELPLSVRYGLQDLQNTEGFEFADFPMPYDIQVLHDPDNKDPKAKYRTTGIPKMVPLAAEEEAEFDEAMKRITPEQYIEKRKNKAKTGSSAPITSAEDTREAPLPTPDGYPTEDINPSDVPF